MSLTFLRGQVGYMQERGFRVAAISSPGDDLELFGRREGVQTFEVPMQRRITPLRDIVAIVKLIGCMRRIRPMIVHAHTPKGGLLGMVSAFLNRTPVRIYHMRGLPLTGARGIRRAVLWLGDRLACVLAHRVICVSHSVRREAIAAGLCPPSKIQVLLGGSGNGVDAAHRFNPAAVGGDARAAARERFGIPADAEVIGFVGRLVRDKGLVELGAAWATLRERYPRLHLLVVGPFEDHDPLPAATETILRTDPRIHLVGMEWDTPELYSAMDLVVLPTYREGFPNVPLEAAAMALPVVATEIAGCIDAVEHGKTGMLVPPRDPDALGAALATYLDDPGLRQAHGTAARARVRVLFRPDALWEALHGVYRELLAEAAPDEALGQARTSAGAAR
jgi:glycosyltransferase involved in cell wall biosynthesis